MAVYKQCITDQSTIRVSAGYPYYSDGSVHGGIDTVHTNHQAYAPMAGAGGKTQTLAGGAGGEESLGEHIGVRFEEGRVGGGW